MKVQTTFESRENGEGINLRPGKNKMKMNHSKNIRKSSTNRE